MQKARGESDEVCVKYKGRGEAASPKGPASLIQTKKADESLGSGDTSKVSSL